MFIGQHEEILIPHVEYLNITPDHQLEVMKKGQNLVDLMARLFDQLSHLIEKVDPDIVIIGDAASSMASALVAHRMGLPIAHTKTGLRTYVTTSPSSVG